jgi:hypothetical protein
LIGKQRANNHAPERREIGADLGEASLQIFFSCYQMPCSEAQLVGHFYIELTAMAFFGLSTHVYFHYWRLQVDT